jgi:hypothetical protein
MPQNTSPIFTLTPYVGKVNLTGNIGLAASDGAGTIGATPGLYLLVTGQTNGTLISRIHIHAYATTPTNTSATVLRFYHSTQASGVCTAANTWLIYELGLGILAAANATTALTPIDIPLNYVVPSAETILVTSHSNLAANTGFQVLAIGGSY